MERKLLRNWLLLVTVVILLGGCAPRVDQGSVDAYKVIVSERTTKAMELNSDIQLAYDKKLFVNSYIKVLNNNLLQLMADLVTFTDIIMGWETTGLPPDNLMEANTRTEFGLSLLQLQLMKVHGNEFDNEYHYDFGGYKLNQTTDAASH